MECDAGEAQQHCATFDCSEPVGYFVRAIWVGSSSAVRADTTRCKNKRRVEQRTGSCSVVQCLRGEVKCKCLRGEVKCKCEFAAVCTEREVSVFIFCLWSPLGQNKEPTGSPHVRMTPVPSLQCFGRLGCAVRTACVFICGWVAEDATPHSSHHARLT